MKITNNIELTQSLRCNKMEEIHPVDQSETTNLYLNVLIMATDQASIISFEKIYEQGDRFVTRYLIAYGVFSLLLANVHDTWDLCIKSNLVIWALFFVFKYLVNHKTVFRYLLCMLLFTYPALFITQLNGFPLTHLFYFMAATILLIYQRFSFQIVGFIPGIIHYEYNIYLAMQGHDMTSFIGYATIDVDKFLILGNLIPMAAAFTGYSIIKITRTFSSRNIETIKASQKQNQIIEVNKQHANKISEGNLEIEMSPAENDSLGHSLLRMKNSLQQAAQKEFEEKYIAEGINQIAEILRKNQHDLKVLAQHVLENLVKYTNCNQGAIYVTSKIDEKDILSLYGCYAYGKKKYIDHTIEFGQGLAGQIALEKEMTILKKIPTNYIHITSGLGDAPPGFIVVFPLIENDHVHGVVELASFHELKEHQLNLFKTVSESIASTIHFVKNNQRTNELLEQAKLLTQDMQEKEEELRQNIEELEANREDSSRRIRFLEEEISRLKEEINVLNAIEKDVN